MRLLALAVLVLLAPQDPKPQFRRSLTLVNRSAEPLQAGTQVSVNLYKGVKAPQTADVHVLHEGKPLPSTTMNASAWFKLAADIPAGGRDSGYQVRYGDEKAPRQGADVFDFFEDFQTTDPAAERWDWDKELDFRRDAVGLSVTGLPKGGNEHSASSFTPRAGPLEGAFIFDIDVFWDLPPESAFTFAAVVDVGRKVEITKEDRERVAALILELAADDIQARERAIALLIKQGAAAIPQLEEAARTAEPESRVRSVAVLDAIYRENPLFATGFIATGDPLLRPSRLNQLGTSRTIQKEAFGSKGGSRITLARDPAGRASIAWSPGRPNSQVLEGKALRLRLSFWSTHGGSIGEFRIIRVIRRRYVEHMPAAEFGPEEPVR